VSAVAFYISGHGFGHASRQIEIINTLGALRPDLRILARTSAPQWLFDRTVRVPFEFQHAECDTGAVQLDSLHLDVDETIRRAATFHATLDSRTEQEAAILRNAGVALVIADAPPLACAAAAAAGVPAIVISNFTWDWIYEGYRESLAAAPRLIPTIKSAYANAAEAWRLPMHGGFEPFTVMRDLPFVARHATHGRAHTRALLGLPQSGRLALSSFGGYGIDGFDPAHLDCLDDIGVVLTGRDGGHGAAPPGVHLLDESRIYDQGLRYEDLVHAVDVVVTKPGYGIISECLANGTALLYTSRGRFREYDVLVAAMPRFLRAGYIEPAALLAGRWKASLRALFAMPEPPERPETNGAAVAAQGIEQRLTA
jgi:L-arabinokinase